MTGISPSVHEFEALLRASAEPALARLTDRQRQIVERQCDLLQKTKQGHGLGPGASLLTLAHVGLWLEREQTFAQERGLWHKEA